jgi:hypothetical protein
MLVLYRGVSFQPRQHLPWVGLNEPSRNGK